LSGLISCLQDLQNVDAAITESHEATQCPFGKMPVDSAGQLLLAAAKAKQFELVAHIDSNSEFQVSLRVVNPLMTIGRLVA